MASEHEKLRINEQNIKKQFLGLFSSLAFASESCLALLSSGSLKKFPSPPFCDLYDFDGRSMFLGERKTMQKEGTLTKAPYETEKGKFSEAKRSSFVIQKPRQCVEVISFSLGAWSRAAPKECFLVFARRALIAILIPLTLVSIYLPHRALCLSHTQTHTHTKLSLKLYKRRNTQKRKAPPIKAKGNETEHTLSIDAC